MAWYDVRDGTNCMSIDEWNTMIDYIEANRCQTQSEVTFYLYSDCSNSTGQKFKFDYLGNVSLLYGGASTGDAFKIIANTIDTYPFMILEGDDYVEIRTTNDIYFYEQAEQMFKFSLNGTISEIWGSDDAGDDLFIYANQNDNCSVLELFGDSGASLLIKAGSIFDISTCSDEKLFEVDSGVADKHIDCHCLDAHNFVLELRTTDPSAPTCLGQIWFRVDLV